MTTHDRKGYLAAVAAIMAATLAAQAASGAATAEPQAREILQTTGVRGGLVVHVGCGDGTLTAALLAGDAYLVQGLDTSAEKVAEVRKAFCAKRLAGRVTARVFDGKTLPFRDNTVNPVSYTHLTLPTN